MAGHLGSKEGRWRKAAAVSGQAMKVGNRGGGGTQASKEVVVVATGKERLQEDKKRQEGRGIGTSEGSIIPPLSFLWVYACTSTNHKVSIVSKNLKQINLICRANSKKWTNETSDKNNTNKQNGLSLWNKYLTPLL